MTRFKKQDNTGQRVFKALLCLFFFNHLEHLLQSPVINSPKFLVSFHREGLASSSLAICEDTYSESLDTGMHQRRHVFEDLLLRGSLVENAVKLQPFRLSVRLAVFCDFSYC